MNKTLKQFLFVGFAFLPFASFSQMSDPGRPGVNPFRDDQNARNVSNKPDELNAEGSPFLIDDFIPMEVTLVQGGVYTGVKIKLNVVDNEIFFTTESGQILATSTPVKRLRFNRVKEDESGMEEVILESIGAPINSPNTPIYQVLTEGKARLLKQIIISYSDVRKYPEGIMARVFKKKSALFASVNGQPPVKIEKNKSDVLSVLKDKQKEVSSFIDKEKLKCKTEEDIAKVFSYYSSL